MMKAVMTAADTYVPVPFNPAAEAARLQRESPAFARAWAEQGDEFAALDVMGVKQSALARVEGALASRNHAPSLATLRKYAQAVGCRLELRMVPQ